MANPLRVLYQMWKYHSTYDIEKALRQRLWDGIALGRKQVNERPCGHTEPLFVIAPGVFTCPECRQISQPLPLPSPRIARPTINLAAPANSHPERHTDPAAFVSGAHPFLAYVRAGHQHVSPRTEQHRALHPSSQQKRGKQ